MTPLTQNPKFVGLTENGKLVKVGTNIAPLGEVELLITDDPVEFANESKGMPFVSDAS